MAAGPVDGPWELPNGWRWERLQEVAEINPRTDLDLPADAPVAFVPMAAVEQETGKVDVSQTRRAADVAKGFTRFRQGDVLFAKITPCMENGKVAEVPALKSTVGAGSTEFHVIRSEAFAPGFLFNYLVQRSVRQEAERNMSGSAGQRRVPADYLRLLPIPVPPIETQRKTVARIKELFADIDTGSEALENSLAGLEAYRCSLIQAATSGELTASWRAANGSGESGDVLASRIVATSGTQRRRHGADLDRLLRAASADYALPLPRGWCRVPIGLVTECLDYARVPVSAKVREERGGSVPYYGANGQVSWIDDHLFDEKLVLVVEDETFIGRKKDFSYLIDGKSWVNNHAHVLRAGPFITPGFLNLALSRYPFTPLTTGTTGRKKLTQAALNRAPISVPPLSEQEVALDLFYNQLATTNELAGQLTNVNTSQVALRESVLSAAYRGELVA